MVRKVERMVEKGIKPLGMRDWFVCAAVSVCVALCLSSASVAYASSKGTLTTYTCGADSTTKSSFVNMSGQSFIRAAAGPLVPLSNSAGGDWEGLNNTSFQSLSFDVKGSPWTAESGDLGFYVILHGADGVSGPQNETVEFFGCHDFSSALDLGNGFTRYTIKQGARSFANHVPTPATVNRIVFNQYPVSASTHSVVFGNILLNGVIKPVESMTPTYCPPITGDGAN
jgi:hypothetical protein